ncbi:MAG: succinate dehydrogenase assembly factor 2 [Zetaproteobacteria bacterium CG_4_9_14_3_um_filter_53_7]|nr:MAG: succinate dehydrogenase assembly factor 2 [Zetaproteobacteria bacterium CG_4_9_14_3_um_filter_53_7]
MSESELHIRRMLYRLNRQGMLELDTWLAPLLQADFTDSEVVDAVEMLLQCEAPELQAMMQGEKALPEILERWLSCR